MKQEIICEKCKGGNIKKDGVRKTPSELAIPELDLSTNRWLSLIKLSKSNKI